MNSKLEKTIYNIGKKKIKEITKIYLELVKDTSNFHYVELKNLDNVDKISIMIGGIRSLKNPLTATPEEVLREYEQKIALKFDIENSITVGVYRKLEDTLNNYYNEVEIHTNNFTEFDAEFIYENPYYLPLYQHIGGILSKSKLKNQVGTVSDTNISKPASMRLADYLNEVVDSSSIERTTILGKLGSTLEGIVRDLVGRIMLETIVANALEEEGVNFQREEEYNNIEGVVYNFRADFVLPNSTSPKVFIEVRKSSSRHASLYAKDKMFSAINWKGKNKDMLAVIVVDGEWTNATLDVMTNVFDYVIPINQAPKLAQIISAYLNGDKSKLKWIIDFNIRANS
ncbi:hypothetical protein SAMN05421781_0308 [Marinococcus luteus]|uniref:Uncharacterized protein n=1 Tax=Marinococcus luteus TaxID=1122204 RepID=A0A1H2QG15_9BACI|nr:hypothetical protein [Marinococcus luteus]SDW06183.1 hypothetical protein SAMN05421781_0308 [Marinococcus luteus]